MHVAKPLARQFFQIGHGGPDSRWTKYPKGRLTPHTGPPSPPIPKLKKSFIEKIDLPFGLFCPISGVPLDAPTLKWRGAGKTSVWKILWFFCPSTVPCLGLSASKSVQQISQYGRGPACLPPGTRIQSFLAMFVFCDNVFEPPAQQARLEQHLYAFPLSRKVCSCMPEGISVAAVLPRRAQLQLSLPRAGVGDGLGTHLGK